MDVRRPLRILHNMPVYTHNSDVDQQNYEQTEQVLDLLTVRILSVCLRARTVELQLAAAPLRIIISAASTYVQLELS